MFLENFSKSSKVKLLKQKEKKIKECKGMQRPTLANK